jgi:hypothetical protein
MAWYVGLDLGQAQDYTALAAVEQTEAPAPTADADIIPAPAPDIGEAQAEAPTANRPAKPLPHFAVRHLNRWQLGTPYPAIVADVAALLAADPLKRCTLCVDATGVGRAVIDLFRQAKLPARLSPITITAGHSASLAGDGWHVPKKDLVAIMQTLLQGRRLGIARRLPEAETLKRELAAFRVKVTAAANETFEAWRERDHDDLVFAMALPLWYAARGRQKASVTIIEDPLGESMPPWRRRELERLAGDPPWSNSR